MNQFVAYCWGRCIAAHPHPPTLHRDSSSRGRAASFSRTAADHIFNKWFPAVTRRIASFLPLADGINLRYISRSTLVTIRLRWDGDDYDVWQRLCVQGKVEYMVRSARDKSPAYISRLPGMHRRRLIDEVTRAVRWWGERARYLNQQQWLDLQRRHLRSTVEALIIFARQQHWYRRTLLEALNVDPALGTILQFQSTFWRLQPALAGVWISRWSSEMRACSPYMNQPCRRWCKGSRATAERMVREAGLRAVPFHLGVG